MRRSDMNLARADREAGGLLDMFLAFFAFVGVVTLLLAVWVAYIIKTREPAPARAPMPTPALPPTSVTTSALPRAPEPIIIGRPDALRQRRVSFKTCELPDRRGSSESERGSTAGSSSADSAPPETPTPSFVSTPIIRMSASPATYFDDRSPSESPVSSITPPTRRRFSGFKALRGGSLSRTSSPEPVVCCTDTMSDGETSAAGARSKSFARMVRSLGSKRSRRTKSDMEPQLSPSLAPSAFKPKLSLVDRVIRRSSLRTSPAPSTPDMELHGPEPAIPEPEPRRSSIRSPQDLANADLRRVAGLGIERPSSAPARRPELISAWTAPLDRHQRQARAADEFGVWARSPVAPAPRRVSPLFSESQPSC